MQNVLEKEDTDPITSESTKDSPATFILKARVIEVIKSAHTYHPEVIVNVAHTWFFDKYGFDERLNKFEYREHILFCPDRNSLEDVLRKEIFEYRYDEFIKSRKITYTIEIKYDSDYPIETIWEKPIPSEAYYWCLKNNSLIKCKLIIECSKCGQEKIDYRGAHHYTLVINPSSPSSPSLRRCDYGLGYQGYLNHTSKCKICQAAKGSCRMCQECADELLIFIATNKLNMDLREQEFIPVDGWWKSVPAATNSVLKVKE